MLVLDGAWSVEGGTGWYLVVLCQIRAVREVRMVRVDQVVKVVHVVHVVQVVQVVKVVKVVNDDMHLENIWFAWSKPSEY